MTGTEKIAGVIGGMGPEATIEFLRRVVALTPAHDDQDHIRILIDCNPKIPSRIKALFEGHGADPTPILCAMARGLMKQGADFLVVPCNTAHHYLPSIQSSVDIPVLDMVSLVRDRLLETYGARARIGLLASPAVRQVRLYDTVIHESGMTVLHADDRSEADLLDIIKAVKSGQISASHRRNYNRVCANMAKAGADAVVLACTELSVMGIPTAIRHTAVDALDLLAEATIRQAKG